MAQHFATDAETAGFLARHDPPGRGQDGDAHAAEYPGDILLAGIDPTPRLADPLQAGDDRPPVFSIPRVFQPDPDHGLGAILSNGVVFDEAFILQNSGDGQLHL